MMRPLNRDQDRARRWMRLRSCVRDDRRRRKKLLRLYEDVHATPEGRIWGAIARMGEVEPEAASWARASTIDRVRETGAWAGHDAVAVNLPDGTRMWVATKLRGSKWQAGFEAGIRALFRQWLWRTDVAPPAREEAEKGSA